MAYHRCHEDLADPLRYDGLVPRRPRSAPSSSSSIDTRTVDRVASAQFRSRRIRREEARVPGITLQQATTIVESALRKARETTCAPLAVAVPDDGGHLKAFARE